MELTVREIRDCKTYTYMVLQSPNGDTPIVQTGIFLLDENSLLNHGTFKIPKSLCYQLYEEIQNVEAEVEKIVKTLDDAQLTKLAPKVQQYIKARRSDPNWKLLRPNYFNTGEDKTLYLKGNKYGASIYDMDTHNFLLLSELGPGYYQFTIRACMVYMGPHKWDNHIASLQLRIQSLSYSRNPPQSFIDSMMDSMADSTEDEEDDQNNISDMPVPDVNLKATNLLDLMDSQPMTPMKRATYSSVCPAAPKRGRRAASVRDGTPKKPELKRQNAITKADNINFNQ